MTSSRCPGPIRHAWRLDVAYGRFGRSRRFAKSFQNTRTSAAGRLEVACIAVRLRHLSQPSPRPAGLARAAWRDAARRSARSGAH
jgi:putative transposase